MAEYSKGYVLYTDNEKPIPFNSLRAVKEYMRGNGIRESLICVNYYARNGSLAIMKDLLVKVRIKPV